VEPFAAKELTEDAFGIDHTVFTLSVTFPFTELVVCMPQSFIRQRRVSHSDIFEPLCCQRIVGILIWMVFDGLVGDQLSADVEGLLHGMSYAPIFDKPS
jgi:hypothetical protein